jgi:arylsulfatase A-like enzyme
MQQRRMWIWAALLLPLALAVNTAQAQQTKKPNILLIYADDLGYGELGCYGNRTIPTPNIDKLAAGGIRCTQGYVSAPLCSPSRAGLMTARYPTRYGHENNTMAPGKHLPDGEVTLAQRLKSLGYATGIIGKWHLGGQASALPTQRGFNDYFGVLGNPGSYFQPKGFVDSSVSAVKQPVKDKNFYTTDAFAARAARWLEAHKDRPWFLYLPFNAVHAPHEATEKYLQRFAQLKAKERNFAAMLSALDDAVGVVLTQLRELGLEENTLVFFISDNGAPGGRGGNGPLRGGKYTTWEGGVRVPFILQWKGTLAAGKTYDLPVIQLDVMPTCVAAAGGKTDPAWQLDGVNLLPYLAGDKSDRPHETLYWRIDGMWAIRRGDLKLVHAAPGNAPPQLFDLAKDTGEASDLAATRAGDARELKSLWDRWNAEQAPPARPEAQGSGGDQ